MKIKNLRLNFHGLLLGLTLILSSALSAQTDVTDTYLNNPGFDLSCNYLASGAVENLGTSDNGSTVLTVTDWTSNYSGWSAGASFEYGFPGTLNGNDIPATGSDGSTTGAGHGGLGVCAAWGGATYYTQDVTLPAGSYTLSYKVMSFGPVTAGSSMVSWIPDAGDAVTSTAGNFALGAWTDDQIAFSLSEETSGKIQIGIQGVNAGSSGNGRFIFDDLLLEHTAQILSNDATLSELSIDVGHYGPTMDLSQNNYFVAVVPVGTTSVNVTASVNDANATLTGGGAVDLTSGSGDAVVVVTAEDGITEKTYTIHFVASDNLIELNDADGATGTDSEQNKWGWMNSAVDSWGEANAGGVRYMDVTDHTDEDGNTYTGRVILQRWDYGGLYPGSTYAYPVYFTGACNSYSLSGLFEWWNNGAQPTYSFAISDAPEGGNIVASQEFLASATKNQLIPFEMSFNVPTEGLYYLQVTEAAGGNGIIGLAELAMTANTEEILSVTTSSLTFHDYDAVKSFLISGNALTNDVTLTAPAGITLDVSTITAANAQCGVTVTATFDGTGNVMDSIYIEAGDLKDTITVIAYGPLSITEGQRYWIMNESAGLALGEDAANQGVKIYTKASTPDQAITLAASHVPGQYFLTNEATGYLYLSKANTWNMNWVADTSTTSDSARYELTEFEPGKFYIHNVAKSAGSVIATDATNDGSSVYADKNTSSPNNVWVFEEYASSPLVSHWKLDEGSGTVVGDDITGANGDISGNGVDWISGVDGSALDFTSAVDTAIIIVEESEELKALNLNDVSLTVSLLVKIDPAGSEQTMLMKGDNGTDGPNGNGNRYAFSAKEGQIYWAVDDNVTKSQLSWPAENYPVNQWAHLVGVRHMEDDSLYLYLNGVKVFSELDLTGALDLDSMRLIIGNYHNKENKLRGAIDDIRIMNVAMTDAEVLALYESYTFPASDISSLSDLQVNGSTVIGFDPATMLYNVTVPHGTSSVELSATASDSKATISGTGTIDVSGGSASVDVVVTAEDESTSTYTVSITVAANNDASLSVITVEPGTMTPNFDPAISTYTVEAPVGTTSVTVSATPNDANASIEGLGVVDVSSGSETVEVVVTAENGITKATYTLNITVLTSIQDLTNSGMKVYPTIGQGRFNVEFAGISGAIEVFDITGKLVLSKKAQALKEEFLLENAGIYMVRLSANGQSKLVKIVSIK